MRILYITYDGLTDPLGASQILPYLTGLAQLGHSITILSAEKNVPFKTTKDLIENTIQKYNIKWVPLQYHAEPKIISTLQDIHALKAKAKELHLKNTYDVVHCRSYVTSIVGLWLKKKYGVKFVFDMRGFWADERVDGRIWNLKNPVFARIYKYFKKKELDFLNEADYTISLTNLAKEDIHNRQEVKNQPIPIQVIPCCVDQDVFNDQNISLERKTALKKELGIQKGDFVLTYLGSIGTWYLLDEMMQFFTELVKHKKSSKFLFITHETKEIILEVAKRYGVGEEHLIVKKADRSMVPELLSLSTASIFFIMPVYSKTASCPTKLGEVLSMGIPVITNSGVGDVDTILSETKCGITIRKFDPEHYAKAISEIDDLLLAPKENLRQLATKHFSLDQGVRQYDQVYSKMSSSD